MILYCMTSNETLYKINTDFQHSPVIKFYHIHDDRRSYQFYNYFSVKLNNPPEIIVDNKFQKFQGSKFLFKGSDRPDELGVVSGINRSGILWDCGAGHSFSTKLCRHLVFSVFPFSPSTVQSSGNEKNFRQNQV